MHFCVTAKLKDKIGHYHIKKWWKKEFYHFPLTVMIYRLKDNSIQVLPSRLSSYICLLAIGWYVHRKNVFCIILLLSRQKGDLQYSLRRVNRKHVSDSIKRSLIVMIVCSHSELCVLWWQKLSDCVHSIVCTEHLLSKSENQERPVSMQASTRSIFNFRYRNENDLPFGGRGGAFRGNTPNMLYMDIPTFGNITTLDGLKWER